MQSRDGGSEKMERKIIEKNRRTHMKKLCFQLNSLVPSLLSLSDHKLITQESQFDHSIAYIEQLRKRIEALKHKRDEALKLVNDGNRNINPRCNVNKDRHLVGCGGVTPRSSTVEVQELEGGLKMLLISSSQTKVSVSEIIRIVEDGGAEVVKIGYTTLGEKVIYTLHAKARVTRIGIEVSSVQQKLQDLINQSS